MTLGCTIRVLQATERSQAIASQSGSSAKSWCEAGSGPAEPSASTSGPHGRHARGMVERPVPPVTLSRPHPLLFPVTANIGNIQLQATERS